MLNADFIKTEVDAAGKKVSPLAKRIEQLYVGPNPQFTTCSQAAQFAMDALLDEFKRILLSTAAQTIAHPDSFPLSNDP